MTDEPSADELKHEQESKERLERTDAAEAPTEADAATHLRRAEKASYLQEKLDERERAEAEAEKPDR